MTTASRVSVFFLACNDGGTIASLVIQAVGRFQPPGACLPARA